MTDTVVDAAPVLLTPEEVFLVWGMTNKVQTSAVMTDIVADLRRKLKPHLPGAREAMKAVAQAAAEAEGVTEGGGD